GELAARQHVGGGHADQHRDDHDEQRDPDGDTDDLAEREPVPGLGVPLGGEPFRQPRGEPLTAERVDDHGDEDAEQEHAESGHARPDEPGGGAGGEAPLARCDSGGHQPLPPVVPRYRSERRPRTATTTTSSTAPIMSAMVEAIA